MKKLLYAAFALMTTLPMAYAVPVTDLNPETIAAEPTAGETPPPRQFAWIWSKKDDKEDKEQKKHESESVALPKPQGAQTPHIALLLPLTGEYHDAAMAIREGFISAYYLERGARNTDVRIYDTQADKNIVAVYEQALSHNANMVVGPLTKQGIETLIDSKAIDNDIPLLTLNTVETRTHLPRYLFPFALNPEDEAYRLAEQAYHDGRRRAVALAQDDSYGGRAFQAFKRRFEQLGGRVVDIIYFDPERPLEDPVRYILQVDEKSNRAAPFHMDFVFLAAKPQQARQIPPLMKFFYAQDLPIYAMSSVYSGTPNPGLDNDLNGVVICDSPWVLSPDARNPELNNMATQLLTSPVTQERLFAFGVDAFLVAQQMRGLSDFEKLNVSGATGQLFMDKSGFIVRNPPCARFSLGVPRAL